MMESQQDLAQRIYNARASTYEDSWHPDYSKRMMELVPLKAGDKVLVLCCGTGLESFIAASLVGPDGRVVGVDVSTCMLAEARGRQTREPEVGSRLQFIEHDVTDLDASAELAGQELKGDFDLLICSNAFVLFEKPAQVIRHWKPWLKEGGRMAIDITHEHNLLQGLFIEEVANEMELPWPSNRRWIQNKHSFSKILGDEGLLVEHIKLLDKVTGHLVLQYSVGDADKQFEDIFTSPFALKMNWTKEQKTRGNELFRKKWEAVAEDRKVNIVDALYLYIAKV